VARARNLKPGFFLNEKLAEQPFEARLFYQGLWCLADCEGKLEWRPKRIKVELFPYDDVDCTVLAQCLYDAGFVLTYVVDGIWYLWLPTFTKHQNPNVKEKPRGFPDYSVTCAMAPCQHHADTVPARPLTESPLLKTEDLSLEGRDQPTKAKPRGNYRQRLEAYLGDNQSIPDDWANWAATILGFDQQRITDEWGKFCDHHAAAGNTMASWPAAWRKWCRNSIEFAARDSRRSGGLSAKPRSSLAAAVAFSVAQRHGTSGGSDGVGGMAPAGSTGENAGAGSGRLKPGDVPF
jgi:hypothetical protein